MQRYCSHELEMEGHEALSHHAKSFLAIVDLDSYASLTNPTADYFDVLSHMCEQVDSLKAVMWETPPDTLKLNLILTNSSRISNELTRTHRLVFDGCVRTATGQLCLTDDERLVAAARRGDRDLLHGRSASKTHCPHILSVPPGVISVGAFCRRAIPGVIPEIDSIAFDYTVLMRHYPFPPPRIAPVRLSGGLIPWVGDDSASRPWGGEFTT